MFRRELLTIGALVAALLLAVSLSVTWVARSIRHDASQVASDTLPGLIDAGAAVKVIQENWLNLHQMSSLPPGAEKSAAIEQILSNSTAALWREYGESILDSTDRRNYDALLEARTNFLQVRAEFIEIVRAGSVSEANAFLAQKLSLAHDQYLALAEQIFDYQVRKGRESAARIIRLARMAPFIFCATGLFIFASGFIVGLRGALTGLELVFRRRRKPGRKQPAGVESREL